MFKKYSKNDNIFNFDLYLVKLNFNNILPYLQTLLFVNKVQLRTEVIIKGIIELIKSNQLLSQLTVFIVDKYSTSLKANSPKNT